MNNTMDHYLIKGGAGKPRTGPYQRPSNANTLQGNYPHNPNNSSYDQSYQRQVSGEKENTMAPGVNIYSTGFGGVQQAKTNYESNYSMTNNGFNNQNQYNSGYNDNQCYPTQPVIADELDFDQSYECVQQQAPSALHSLSTQSTNSYNNQRHAQATLHNSLAHIPMTFAQLQQSKQYPPNIQQRPMQQMPAARQQQMQNHQQQMLRQQSHMPQQASRLRFQSLTQNRNKQQLSSKSRLQQYEMQQNLPTMQQMQQNQQLFPMNQNQQHMSQTPAAPLMVEMGSRFPQTRVNAHNGNTSSFNQGNIGTPKPANKARLMGIPPQTSMPNISPAVQFGNSNTDLNETKSSWNDEEGEGTMKIIHLSRKPTVAPTATLINALNLRKSHPDLHAIYEVYGNCVNARAGKLWCEKILLLRDHTGPVMQVSFFEVDRHLDDILPGDLVRAVGKMSSRNHMTAFSVRKASQPELAAVSRLYGVSIFDIKKHNK